jgi:hypothetical protein
MSRKKSAVLFFAANRFQYCVIMKPRAKVNTVLGWIGEVLGVRGSCHHQKGVLLIISSRRNLNFLRTKKEVQEAFDDDLN